jgi:hypothetical protein
MSNAAKRTRIEHLATGKPEVRKAREPGGRLSPNDLLILVAKHPMFIRNMRVPEFTDAFPFNPELRTVGKYFPIADGGPLFVDEVSHPSLEAQFTKKKEVMRAAGKRYLILRETTDLQDAMEQITA